MRTEAHEERRTFSNHLIHHSQVAAHAETPIPGVLMAQRMVVEDRVLWLGPPQQLALIKAHANSFGLFLQIFFEAAMVINRHRDLLVTCFSRYARPSAAEENAGEILTPRSKSSMAFLSDRATAGLRGRVSTISTSSTPDPYACAARESTVESVMPFRFARLAAAFFTLTGRLNMTLVFIYIKYILPTFSCQTSPTRT